MSEKPPELRLNRTLFVLVFLSGVAAALVTLFLSDFIRSKANSEHNNLHHFPDAAHIQVIDESASFHHFPRGTELQKPKTRDVTKAEDATDCENEAFKSVDAARSSKGKKAVERAHKLFKHAMALCPKHPLVLIQYGEFMESLGEDILEADHLFVRAIAFSKEESEERTRALQNRKRTAMVVEELDRSMLTRIDDKKKSFQRISEHSSSLKRAKKEAYFQHIYHTIGIEGSTMTLAQTRSILETKLAVGGKSVMEHNEVLGLDAALRYINQTLVDKVGEITKDDILQIHKRVIGYVDPIEAGMMRSTQVYVGDYVPPHPSHIEMLMERFILWLNSPERLDLHPVKYAALAHYKLVYIHPFVDGNGRTSRLLMNLILMQAGYPPVIIRKQDRLMYYQHLVTANEGDIRPFVRFIAECTERTLDAYIQATKDYGPGLKPFDDSEHTISSADEHFEHHDKIIMGGMVGPNITVTP